MLANTNCTPMSEATTRGMLCAEEEKWACPICRDIVEDLTCEVAKTCCKNRGTQVHDLAVDRSELERRLQCALKQMESVESQNQGLRLQLTEQGDKIEHLQTISYEKNSILLERQETVDELTRTNSRLLYQIQNMERKLRDFELDKINKYLVGLNTNEKLRHSQQYIRSKDKELKSVTDKLNETSKSLEIVSEKYSQYETLLTSVYKENAQLKFDLKKCENEIAEKNKKLKLIPKLEIEKNLAKSKSDEIEELFSFIFREYAFICATLTKRRATFDETKEYVEDTFHSINSYLQVGGERPNAVIDLTLEYEKLLRHPKHKELTKKLEETLRITQALIDASDQLKRDKQRLENAVEVREEKLQECMIKLKKLAIWSIHVTEQKMKLKPPDSPKRNIIPSEIDRECQTDVTFGDGLRSGVKMDEIVDHLILHANITKLESENDTLKSENLNLREDFEKTQTCIRTMENSIEQTSNLNLEFERELDALRARCTELTEQNEKKSQELEQCDELRRDAELRVDELLERPFQSAAPQHTARQRLQQLFANRRSSPLTPMLLPRHWMLQRDVQSATPPNVVEPSEMDVSEVELSFVERQNAARETMSKVLEEVSGLVQIYGTNSFQLSGKEEALKRKIEILYNTVTDILNEEIE